ncbi:MAG: TetR/AcrR family transcriptional regulator [Hyphomicrobiales bacterium]|nr:TetR/AcrR family transcriptional regulator [Hyphomicrobiales bacterium]
MASDVKKRMIEQTALSLARRGLQRTSFTEVLAASGAPRGSLYHHFPGGKDELVVAAVRAAGQFALQAMAGAAGQPAPDVAAAFADVWRAILVRSEYGAGCAIAAVTVAAESGGLLDEAAAMFRSWQALLSGLLLAGGAPQARAGALAASLIATFEGAVVLARAERSLDTFDLIAREQIAAIEAACTAVA